jgi:CheY-like chemotaxis protein
MDAGLPRILIADDNPGDIELTRLAFEEAGVHARFEVAPDGAVALAVLRRLATSAEPPLQLILLDLNMPKASGQEVLAFIRHEPSLARIPTVILSSSNSPKDRQSCLQLGVDRYLVKPSLFEHLIEMARELAPLLSSASKPIKA